MLDKVVCVSKHKSRWHQHLTGRFLDAGIIIHYIYINEARMKDGLAISFATYIDAIIEEINEIDCDHVIYDLEFSMLLGSEDIKHISLRTNTESIGLGLDDERLHTINKVVYSDVDKMFTLPLSVDNYKMLGFTACSILPLEVVDFNEQIEISLSDIYVLIYGHQTKADRKAKIKKIIESGVPCKVLRENIEFDELYSEIRKAPIVMNFSKGSSVITNPLRMVPFLPVQKNRSQSNYIYQTKGRVFEVGYAGSLCVSEYYPRHHELSKPTGMPIFNTDDEMIGILKDLCADRQGLEKKIIEFCSYVRSNYTSEAIGKKIRMFLEESPREHTAICSSIFFEVSKSVSRSVIFRNPFFLARWIQRKCGISKVMDSIVVFFISLIVFLVVIVFFVYNSVLHKQLAGH